MSLVEAFVEHKTSDHVECGARLIGRHHVASATNCNLKV